MLTAVTAKLRRTPLLSIQVATQILVGMACCLLMLVTINRMIESEAEGRLVQIRQIVEARVNPVERQLRTWQFLGMDAALQNGVQDIEKSIPGVRLSFVEATQAKKTASSVIFPDDPNNNNELPNVLVVELPRVAATHLIQPQSFTFWSVLAVGCLLMAAVFWSALFTRRHFHQPISQLHDAFAKLQTEGKLNIDSIEASGEVSALIKNISQMYDVYQGAEAERAVARMTAMLAHDVRKPFSLLRMGLAMLGKSQDPEGVKAILADLLPAVDKAVTNVDGLISDVMEVASTSTTLIQEAARPAALIAATLGETFGSFATADVSIAYSLQHTRMVNVHAQKVGRVLSNIVANAFQAMICPKNSKGQLWFRTRDVGNSVEFCVGNAESFIPPDQLPKVFEAFYTSGKKSGTGLGLAIAEKVVKAHGGRIWCESSKSTQYPDGKVEFYFTLPATSCLDTTLATALPQHSSEFSKVPAAASGDAKEANPLDEREASLEAAIVRAYRRSAAQIRVLVVDDESVYCAALVSSLSCTPALSEAIEIVVCSNVSAALDAARQHFDLIITDVDLGSASLNGFELVRKLRESGCESLICVHSNRVVAADHQTATAAGADAFMPKPMARAQLLHLVVQATHPRDLSARVAATTRSFTHKRREVLVVDDNIFVLDAWSNMLEKDARVHSASSLDGVERLLANDPGLISRLDLVITDYHLDARADGDMVGRTLKNLRPNLQVVLSTEVVCDPGAFGGAIDKVIGKEPISLGSLSALL